MAEFVEVMRQAKRMCAEHEACYKCPLKDHTAMCAGNKNLSCIASKCDVSELERIVMDWAAKHPEPRYPSWSETWRRLFPGARYTPCPESEFDIKMECKGGCKTCLGKPIPADVAEKLGIKPIGGVSDENA